MSKFMNVEISEKELIMFGVNDNSFISHFFPNYTKCLANVKQVSEYREYIYGKYNNENDLIEIDNISLKQFRGIYANRYKHIANVEIIDEKIFNDTDVRLKIANYWDYEYTFIASKVEASVVYFKYCNKYYRAVKIVCKDFCFADGRRIGIALTNNVYTDKGLVYDFFYNVERAFKNYKECLNDINNPAEIDYSKFLQGIIGNECNDMPCFFKDKLKVG